MPQVLAGLDQQAFPTVGDRVLEPKERCRQAHVRCAGEQPRWLVRFAEGNAPAPDAVLRCEALNLEDLFLELTQ